MQITLIHKMYFIKPTYRYDNIKVLMECSELMLIIDVVLNIVIHIYIVVVLCSSNIALLIG